MTVKTAAQRVRDCYATWAESYFDDYCGGKAGYPAVHYQIVRRLLEERGVRTLLDAGCGPASFMRTLVETGIDLRGFDLTPEMVEAGRRVLEEHGVDRGRLWTGSVTDPAAFRAPGKDAPEEYDAAVCIGVLPHVDAGDEPAVLANLRGVLRSGGTVVLEARNELFGLFTLNRKSYELFTERLIGDLAGHPAAAEVQSLLAERFRMDLPPPRRGGEQAPGYDEVLSRLHNPLVLPGEVAAAGFTDVEVLFYHYHALPPMFEALDPHAFREASLAMEEPRDWRGHVMASAFLVVGTAA